MKSAKCEACDGNGWQRVASHGGRECETRVCPKCNGQGITTRPAAPMTEAEQAGQIAKEIRAVIDRARSEYTLAIATVVGVLEIVKLELVAEESRGGV